MTKRLFARMRWYWVLTCLNHALWANGQDSVHYREYRVYNDAVTNNRVPRPSGQNVP
jgi:hypothetical protein